MSSLSVVVFFYFSFDRALFNFPPLFAHHAITFILALLWPTPTARASSCARRSRTWTRRPAMNLSWGHRLRRRRQLGRPRQRARRLDHDRTAPFDANSCAGLLPSGGTTTRRTRSPGRVRRARRRRRLPELEEDRPRAPVTARKTRICTGREPPISTGFARYHPIGLTGTKSRV